MKTERVKQILQLEKEHALSFPDYRQLPHVKECLEAFDIAITAVGAIDQIRWERDMAIEQLKNYGIGFCEKADIVKVIRCKDCDNLYFHKDINGAIISRCCLHEIIVNKNDFCNHGIKEE